MSCVDIDPAPKENEDFTVVPPVMCTSSAFKTSTRAYVSFYDSDDESTVPDMTVGHLDIEEEEESFDFCTEDDCEVDEIVIEQEIVETQNTETPGEYNIEELFFDDVSELTDKTNHDDDDKKKDEFEQVWNRILVLPEIGQNMFEFAMMAREGLAFPDDRRLLEHPNVWIADTAASVHMTPHRSGLRNLRQSKLHVALGDQSSMASKRVGDLHGRICDRYGNELSRRIMHDVAVIGTGYNLFSLSKLKMLGWKLFGDKDAIWMTKGNGKIRFDIPISTKKGRIYAVYIRRELGTIALDAKGQQKVIEYDTAHRMLGHQGAAATQAIGKYLNWLVGSHDKDSPCEACAKGKAKRETLPTPSPNDPLKAGERRAYLDISIVKGKIDKQKKIEFKAPAKPNWRVIVDGKTKYKVSEFFAT